MSLKRIVAFSSQISLPLSNTALKMTLSNTALLRCTPHAIEFEHNLSCLASPL